MAERSKEGIVVSADIDGIAASARPWCGADLLEALRVNAGRDELTTPVTQASEGDVE
jgi:hypothetical protein